MNRAEFGKTGEEKVAEYLEVIRGWRVLERRARFREGEIDLVMEAGKELRFVEVKARSSEKFGGVVESITVEKVQRMRRAVYRWRERHGDFRVGQLYFVGILVDESGRSVLEEYLME